MLLFLILYITSLGQFLRAMLSFMAPDIAKLFSKGVPKEGSPHRYTNMFFCHNLSSSGFNNLYSFVNSQQKEILFKNLH